MPVPPIVSEPRPLLTFVDAPNEAIFCVGVIAGVLLVIVFVGLTEVVRIERGARTSRAPKHRPAGGRPGVRLPSRVGTWPPKHTIEAIVATKAMPAVRASGCDRSQNEGGCPRDHNGMCTSCGSPGIHASYLGPDVERAQQLPVVRREPVTTGGAR